MESVKVILEVSDSFFKLGYLLSISLNGLFVFSDDSCLAIDGCSKLLKLKSTLFFEDTDGSLQNLHGDIYGNHFFHLFNNTNSCSLCAFEGFFYLGMILSIVTTNLQKTLFYMKAYVDGSRRAYDGQWSNQLREKAKIRL